MYLGHKAFSEKYLFISLNVSVLTIQLFSSKDGSLKTNYNTEIFTKLLKIEILKTRSVSGMTKLSISGATKT